MSRKMKAMGIRPQNLKKEAGIPNICPFKDKLLEQLQNKEKADQEKIERLKQQKTQLSLEDMVEEIQQKVTHFKEQEEEKNDVIYDEDANSSLKNTSKKAFYKDLKSVIEQSDVIVEVLDA